MARPAALEGIPLEPPKRELPPNPLDTPADVQAAVEQVPTGRTLTFMGKPYQLAPAVGAIPYWKFGYIATHGVNMEDMEGISVAYTMLRDCFVIAESCEECDVCLGKDDVEPDPDNCPSLDLGDWPRFERDAIRKKASNDDLMETIKQAVEIISARPTQRPSDSSAGPSTTSGSSTGSSPSPATRNGQATEMYVVDDLVRRAGG